MAAIKDDQRVTEDTLKSTEELLKIAEQANKIGVDTLVTLNNQGEQIDNIKDGIDRIKIGVDKANTDLEKIKCCLYCPSFNLFKCCTKKRRVGKATITASPPSDETAEHPQQQMQPVKIEQNLDAVDHVLDNLHGIAVEVGNELDRQNEGLKEIDKSALSDVMNLSQTKTTVKKLIHD